MAYESARGTAKEHFKGLLAKLMFVSKMTSLYAMFSGWRAFHLNARCMSCKIQMCAHIQQNISTQKQFLTGYFLLIYAILTPQIISVNDWETANWGAKCIVQFFEWPRQIPSFKRPRSQGHKFRKFKFLSGIFVLPKANSRAVGK